MLTYDQKLCDMSQVDLLPKASLQLTVKPLTECHGLLRGTAIGGPVSKSRPGNPLS